MAILGKRKSRGDAEAPASSVSELDAEAIFRRHFEAQFEPLDEAAQRAQREQEDDDAVDSDLNSDDDEEGEDSDGDQWGGFSGGEEEEEEDSDEDNDAGAPAVLVIDHSKPQAPKEPKMSKKELKAFMSSKVIDHTAPPTTTTPSTSKPTKAAPPEDAPSLLAQDLELRRLLAESHLFTPSHNNAASTSVSASPSALEPRAFAAGRTRLKATDLRMQALGSKKSVFAQDKMPMNMRKHLVAAQDAREAKRRREAKENGVILERSAQQGGGKKKTGRARQERGVHGPGIGRMRGAELRISEGDVRKIEGSRDTFGRRGRR